jgi:hypothetical protein
VADQVRQIIEALREVGEKVIKQITLDVTANLIETTPVDTGWARANWIPSIGPREGVAGTRENISGAEQEIGKAQVVTEYKIEMGEVHVSNAVPYVQSLNDGHSQQAPAGFVQAAIAKAVELDLKAIETK